MRIKDLWHPIVNGKVAKKKDYAVHFLIDYRNEQLREFHRDYGYASGVRFDYYNLTDEQMDNIEDVYQNNYALVYYYLIEHIDFGETLYSCFVNSQSNVKDIDGLIYKIATSEYADVMVFNSLVAVKSSLIRSVSTN